jgi:hypothetical protein
MTTTEKTYRVIDLAERKPIATGLTLDKAWRFVERTRERTPGARLNISTEYPNLGQS